MTRYSKVNALLIELLIVLLFFTLSQTIIVQVFADAQQTNHKAEMLNRALSFSQDAAEMLAVSDKPEETLQSLGFYKENGIYRYTVDAHYRLTADIARFTQPAGVLTTVTLCAYRDAEILFTLPAPHYQGVKTQ